MDFQEYLRKQNELIAEKDALYSAASRRLDKGDKAGAAVVYALIDETQAELDALVNPNDELLKDGEGLLTFES
jgi:hypothetical protein